MNKLHWMVRRYMQEESGNGDGGSAAPAASSESESGDAVDWEVLNNGAEAGEDDDGGKDDTDTSSSAAEAEAATTTKTAPPEAGATTGKSEAEVQPEKDADGNPITPVVDPELEPELTAEQLAAQQAEVQTNYTKWREGEVARFEKEFEFSEEDASRLQTEPELVLPKLAARLKMEAVEGAIAVIQQMIPKLIPQAVQATDREKEAQDFFFGKNPDLKKYPKQIQQAGMMFRKLNPKASPEEAAIKIGEIVRSSLGLAPVKAGAPAPTPKAAAKPAPHKPVQPGSARSAPVKEDTSIWADLSGDDD